MALKPSLRFALTLLFLHMLAAITVYVTALPWIAKFIVIVSIALSLFYYLARDIFFLLPNSWHEIFLGQGGVTVIRRDGSSLYAQVVYTTVVSPYCIVLRVRVEGRRRLVSKAVFPDALSADEFRELRVRLRFIESL